MTADISLFYSIHNLAHQWPILDALGIFFAQYAIFVLGLGALFVLWGKRQFSFLARSVVAAYALNFLIGKMWFRARPFVELHFQPLINHAATKSFPSDHTTIAFALATIIAMIEPRYRVGVYFFALGIGLGRIFVGVHYPSDVLAGIMIGTLMPLITSYIYREIRKKSEYGQSH